MKAFDDARSALAKDSKESWDDFRVIVIGGKSHEAETGKATIGVAGYPSGDLATRFLKRRIPHYTFQVNYNKTISPHLAGVLTRSWCRARQYYFNIELTSPEGESLVFNVEHHARYVEPSELPRALAAPDVPGAFVARAQNLRDLFV